MKKGTIPKFRNPRYRHLLDFVLSAGIHAADILTHSRKEKHSGKEKKADKRPSKASKTQSAQTTATRRNHPMG